MRLFLVRHGQSEGNVNKQVYFQMNDCDVQLTDKGKGDAVNAADKIHSLIGNNMTNINVFHSTYKRATQTASILYDRLNDSGRLVSRLIPTPLAREREWGSLRDIIEQNLKAEEHFNFYYRPTGGESFADTYQRAAIFHQWMKSTTNCDINVVVAHGEFNKVYLMHLLNWDTAQFEEWANQQNGEVWELDVREHFNTMSIQTPLRVSSYAKRIAKRIAQVEADLVIKTQIPS